MEWLKGSLSWIIQQLEYPHPLEVGIIFFYLSHSVVTKKLLGAATTGAVNNKAQSRTIFLINFIFVFLFVLIF